MSLIHLLRKYLYQIIFLIILFSPFLFFIKPVSTTKFIITDDHEIIRFKTGDLSPSRVFENERYGMGRFRPFYWYIRFFYYFLFGTNPHLWHVNNYILAIVLSALIFIFAKKLLIHPTLALFTSWFSLLNLTAINSWLLLGPQELQATFLLMLSALFLSISKRRFLYSFFGLLFVILMVLTKENFAFFIPSLIILNALFHKNKSHLFVRHLLRLINKILILIMIVSIIASIYFAKNAGFHSNGGTILRTFSSFQYELLLNNTIQFLRLVQESIFIKQLLFFTFGVFILGFINKRYHKYISSKKSHIYLLTISTLFWLIGQLFIYSGRSYVSKHYPMPFIVGLIIWIFYILNIPFNYFNRIVKIFIVIVLIYFQVNIMQKSLESSYSHVINSQKLNAIINSVKSRLEDGDEVLIIGHPSFSIEHAPSMKWFLQGTGKKYNYYFLPTELLLQQKDLGSLNEFKDLDASGFFPNSIVGIDNLPKVDKRLAIIVVNENYYKVINSVLDYYQSIHLVNEILLDNFQLSSFIPKLLKIDSYYADPEYKLFFVSSY